MMKQVAMVLLVALIFIPAVHADSGTTVIDVSAITCPNCFPPSDPVPAFIDIQAQFTLTWVFSSGQFFSPLEGKPFIGEVDEVTAVTGTINGATITGFAPFSWIEGPSLFFPGLVGLSSTTFSPTLQDDNSGFILDEKDGGVPLEWQATLVPEPATWLLVAAGIALMALHRRQLGHFSAPHRS